MSGWFGRRRSQLDAELEEEIRLHLELRAAQLMSRGLDVHKARLEAMRRFGGGDGSWRSLRRAARRRGPGTMRRLIDEVRQDAGYVMRTLLLEPAISAVIVLTLALGIGANSAMFSLIDRLLLRGPAWVRNPDELARFYLTVTRPDNTEFRGGSFGYVSYTLLRDGTHSFAGVAATNSGEYTLGRGAAAERVRVSGATADLFPLLGTDAQLGRFFTTEEDKPPQGEQVAVLGHALWSRRFGGDPGVLGQAIELDGETYTVIGVARPGFTGAGLNRADVWVPMSVLSRNITNNWATAWNAQWLRVVARLKPGVTLEQASAEATEVHRRGYTGRSALYRDARITAAPLHYNLQGKEPLEVSVSRWLLAVTVLVLLVACANVTSLLLARSTRRRQEIAIRLALGIGRGRLLRLLVLHGAFLAVGGGGVALLLAHMGGRVLGPLMMPDVDWGSSPLNARVLAVTALVAMTTGLVAAFIPAVHATRQDINDMLRTGQREGGGRSLRLRSALTIAQAALSVVLLVGAGLFVRSLTNVRGLHLGIEPDRVLNVAVDWPRQSVPTPEERAVARQRERDFYQRALERARGLPGVEHAALAVGTPFQSSFSVDLRASGWDSIPEMKGGGPYVSAVTAGFFETMGTRLLAGRRFTAADRGGSEPVAIVNQTMANMLWPGESALEKCLYVGDNTESPPPCSRVVAIVEDARRFGLREDPAMQYYIPLGQERGFGGTSLLVRPRSEPASMIAAIRRELIGLDPAVQFIGIETLQESLDPQIRPWRLGATMFAMFGVLALIVAAIGLYSLIAYSVASRRHELGVRMVLGARGGDMISMVVRQGTTLAFAGVLLGTGLAFATSRFLESLLFDASPRDPAVFAGVAIGTLVVAVLASLVPALRAARVNPVSAFRVE